MALSEEEQRRLEQLEALLAEDDPRLAHALRGSSGPMVVNGKRLVTSAVGFAAGIGLLVAGMQWGWFLGVIGFLVMFASAAWFILGRPDAGTSHRRDTGKPTSPVPGPRDSSSPFMDKLEERWRKRQDEGR